MKKLSIVLIVTMMLGLGVVMAQTSSSDVVQSSDTVQNAVTESTTTVQKPADCTGEGRGYGNGTKPRPRDGTGFGAKSGNRQKRNAALGQGKGNGLKNGQGIAQCRNNCPEGCKKPRSGKGQKLQKRDGTGQSKAPVAPTAATTP